MSRELQRRINRWGEVPITVAATNTGFIIFAIPSPGQDRADRQWRIDEVIAGVGGPLASGNAIAALFTARDTIKDTSNAGIAASDMGITRILFGPGGSPGPPGFNSLYTSGSVIGVGSIGEIGELDFHPVFVNPQENLGLCIKIYNSGGVAASLFPGFSLSYTIVSER